MSDARSGRPRGSVGLTRRGWTVAGAAAGLLAGGRLLGADELSFLGIAAIAIVLGALVWMGASRPILVVERHIEPARLHVGDAARVDLAVTARTARASPLVELVEPIDSHAFVARFLVAPIEPGATALPAYRLPTERRGRCVLGPTRVARTDPLGLVRRSRVAAPAIDVLVRPRVHAIAAPPLGAGRDLGGDRARTRGQAPDTAGEFLAVRPYETGDDPRGVHWRSSARSDELMVRQYEAPRRGGTLVVLDTRAGSAPPADDPTLSLAEAPFERAVEAAASIVTCLQRMARPVELCTTGGTSLTRTANDTSHGVLDRLATVSADEPDELAAVVHRRRRRPPELVVLVTAAHDDATRRALQSLAARTAALVVVTGGEAPVPTPGAGVVDARTEPFPDAWRRSSRSTSSRRTALSTLHAPGPQNPGSWISAATSARPSPSPH